MQLTEAQIRKIVQQEIAKSNNASRFNLSAVTDHVHNGIDSPRIKEDDLIQSVNTAGSITFGTQGATYTINLTTNFTPTFVLAYGVVTDSAGSPNIRCHTIGSAQLTPGFYLQPESSRSVAMGGPQYPFPTSQPDGSTATVPIQGSSFIYTNDSANTFFAGVSEDHLVDVFTGSSVSDIQARVTLVDFSRSFVKLYVPYLTSGWRINVNYVIT